MKYEHMITTFIENEILINKKLCNYYNLNYSQEIINVVNADFIANYKAISSTIINVEKIVENNAISINNINSNYIASIVMRALLNILSKNPKYMVKTKLIVILEKELYKLFILLSEIEKTKLPNKKTIINMMHNIIEMLTLQNFLEEKRIEYGAMNDIHKNDTYTWEINKIQNNKTMVYKKLNVNYLKTDTLEIFYDYNMNSSKIIKINGKLYSLNNHYKSLYTIVKPNIHSKNETIITDITFLEKIHEIKHYIDWDAFDVLISLYNKNNNQTHEEKIINLFIDKFKDKKILYIYLTYYIDFRGRIYGRSNISPTSSKIFRNMYTYGQYTQEELFDIEKKLQTSKTNNILLKYVKLFDNIFNAKNISNMSKTSILWLFIELSKIHKSKLIKSYSITIETFLYSGYDIYIKKKINTNNIEEIILTKKYIKTIDALLKNAPIEKKILYKDATASVTQHMSRILGYKNKNFMKIVNLLSEDEWYDAYSYIIEKYKEWNKNINKDFYKYLTRKNLKKIIMTISYSVSYRSASKYFYETLDETASESITNFEKKKIETEIKKNQIKELKHKLNMYSVENTLELNNSQKKNIIALKNIKANNKQTYINTFKNKINKINTDSSTVVDNNLKEILILIDKIKNKEKNWTPSIIDIEVKNLYNFLTKKFENLYAYTYSSKEIINQWEPNKIIKTNDNIIIDLNYNVLKYKKYEIKFFKSRKTIIIAEITDKKDIKKTSRSLRANIIHVLDAAYARELIRKFNIITIHDSFGIDIHNTSLLIDEANNIFNIRLIKEEIIKNIVNIEKNHYSIFVLL